MKKGKTTSWDGQRQVDAYILNSGRVITPNRGLLSVGGDESTDADHPFVLYEGYDSVFEHWDSAGGEEAWVVEDARPDHESRPLTPEERREIADFMIARWLHWAEQGDTLPSRKGALHMQVRLVREISRAEQTIAALDRATELLRQLEGEMTEQLRNWLSPRTNPRDDLENWRARIAEYRGEQ